MLVEFKFENFRSFKNETHFTLEPSTQNGKNTNIIETNLKKIPQLYCTIGIFGANASGKSNFILALSLFKFLIKKSFKNEINQNLPEEKYLLSKNTIVKPTSFEISFIYKEKLYKYGLKYSQKEILYESLVYANISEDGSARENKLFTRDKEAGIKAKGIPQAWIDELADNRVFLSEIINNRKCQIPEILDAYDYIVNKLHIAKNKTSLDFTLNMLQSEDKPLMLDYIKKVDLDFIDICIKKVPTEDILGKLKNEKDKNEFTEFMLKRILSGESEILDIRVLHKTEDGNIAELDLDKESEGSKKFLSLTGPIVNALKTGSTLFIDELDASLHPLFVKHIVSLFNDSNFNKNNAQLIFTSHAFYLMDGNTLTRDQILLINKENNCASTVKSLRDFNESRKNKSFVDAYINGLYGAIPNIASLDNE